MRFWKALGGFLCFIGCLAALAGILATALPMVDNEQVRRIIESFSVKTQDGIINAINGAILLCLQRNYWLFGGGLAVLLIGGLMKTFAGKALYQAQEAVHETAAKLPPPKKSVPTPRHQGQAQIVEPVFRSRDNNAVSPYAAAEYGKALSSRDGQASEIARKYLPRSIISTDDSQEDWVATFAKPQSEPVATALPEWDAAEQPAEALAEPERVGVIVCPACNADNPVNLSFCGQCGSKLPSRLTIHANEARQAAQAYAADEEGNGRKLAAVQPEPRQPAGTVSAMPYAGANPLVDSIFSVPAEPVAPFAQSSQTAAPYIDESRTGSEWGKAAPLSRPVSPQADVAPEGMTPHGAASYAVPELMPMAEGWKPQSQPLPQGGKGISTVEGRNARQHIRRFHPPMVEAATERGNVSGVADAVPVVQELPAASGRLAPISAPAMQAAKPNSRVVSTFRVARREPPVATAETADSKGLADGRATDASAQPQLATSPAPETDAGIAREPEPTTGVMTDTSAVRPRIVSTMGKKSI